MLNEKEYIKTRLDDQISWYSHKSHSNQVWFKRLTVLQIIFAALIPLLSGYAEKNPELNIWVGIFGALVAIISAYIYMSKFQQNWIEYRTLCAHLKEEKFKFLTRVAPYNEDNAFQQLVGRVEALIADQNTNWAKYTAEQDEKPASDK